MEISGRDPLECVDDDGGLTEKPHNWNPQGPKLSFGVVYEGDLAPRETDPRFVRIQIDDETPFDVKDRAILTGIIDSLNRVADLAWPESPASHPLIERAGDDQC